MGIILNALVRPSTYIRGLWLAVVALHAWLFARRVIEGEWLGGLNQARLVLGLAACAYGAARMWRPATFLDDSPRKAWAFALLLIVGHFGISHDNYRRIAENTASGVEWNHVVLVTTVLIAAAATAGMTLRGMFDGLGGDAGRQILIPIRHERPFNHIRRHPAQYQRPPPRA